MYQRTVYHNTETSENTTTCPQGAVFVEGTWLSTKIELGLEVHVVTVDFRPFHYA
jgi:hypothetical protein